jgi:hypothetical protein
MMQNFEQLIAENKRIASRASTLRKLADEDILEWETTQLQSLSDRMPYVKTLAYWWFWRGYKLAKPRFV